MFYIDFSCKIPQNSSNYALEKNQTICFFVNKHFLFFFGQHRSSQGKRNFEYEIGFYYNMECFIYIQTWCRAFDCRTIETGV